MRFPGREPLAVLGLSAVGLAAGVASGNAVFALVLAVALLMSWRVAGFAGVTAVCFTAVVLGSSSYPDVKASGVDERWVALGTLAAWPLVSRRVPGLPASRVFLAAIAVLIVLAGLSALWSIDRRLTLERLASFVLLLWVTVVIVPTHASTPEERRTLARAFAVLVTAGAAAGLALGVLDPEIGRQHGNVKALRGWFENSNEVGIWAAALAPCLLALRSRRLALAAGLVVVAMVVASASRSALLAVLILGTAALPIAPARRVALGVTLLATALVLSLTPVRGALPGTAFAKHSARSQTFVSSLTGGRNEAWEATFRAFPHRPAGGFGFGTGDRVFRYTGEDKTFFWFLGGSPSSGYLQILLELGVGGLILLCLALFSAVAAAWRRRDDASTRPFALMAAVMLLVALVEIAITSAGGPFSILLWTGLGVAMGTVPISEVRLPAPLRRRLASLRRRSQVPGPVGASPGPP